MKSCFDYLSTMVPLENGCVKTIDQKEIDKLRKEIIHASRIILLYNLLPNKLEMPFTTPEKEIAYMSKVSNFPFMGISQISQSANFIFNFLFENPRIFASLILSILETDYFTSFCYIILPQVFAYFSSQENLIEAGKLYKEIFDLYKSDIRKLFPVLLPMFRNGTVYKFIESVSSIFLQQFLIDISGPQNKNLDVLIPIHSAFLLECLRANLNQLPFQHLKILREIFNRTTRVKFLDFFLDEFASPLILMWLKSTSLPSDFSLFEKIVVNMRQRIDEVSDLFEDLKTIDTVFEPPKLYESSQDNSYLVYVRIVDVISIAKLLHNRGMLPPILSINEFLSIDSSVYPVYFWCQIYPQFGKLRSNQAIEPLIFKDLKPFQMPTLQNPPELYKFTKAWMYEATECGENVYKYVLQQAEKRNLNPDNYALAFLTNKLIQEAETFEKFLAERVFVSQLKKWRNILNEFKETYIAKRIEFIITHEKIKSTSISLYRTLYDKNHHMETMILFSIEQYVPKILKTFENEILEMEEIWEKSIKQAISQNEIISYGKFLGEQRSIVRDHITDTIKLIRCTWKLPFYNRFRLILKAFSILNDVTNITGYGRKTFSIALQQVKGNIVIPSFIILNSLAVTNDIFMKYSSDKYRMIWLDFESSILVYLGLDPQVVKNLVKLQNQIISKFAKKIYKPFK